MKDETRVLIGRAMAGATFVLTASGVVTLILIGRSHHLLEGLAMFAVFALFAGLPWLAFPLQPANRALWVPALASFIAGLGVAGWAATVLFSARAGLDVSIVGVGSSVAVSDLPPAAAISYQFVTLAAGTPFALMITLWPPLFPNGRLPSPGWRWFVWGAGLTVAAMTAIFVWLWRPGSDLPLGADVEDAGALGEVGLILFLVVMVWGLGNLVLLLIRQRRSSGEIRQQYRWVTIGTLALVAWFGFVDPEEWALIVSSACVAFSVLCYAVAVTKYRLYDIDIVISRTLVYGTLATLIGAVYVLVVVVVGDALGSEAGSITLAVAATAMVAIAFEPARRLAQRWANRLVFGKRATPYEVLSALTRRLAGAEPSEDMLGRMAHLMAQGTGADQATVWLAGPDRLVAGAGWPELPHPDRARSIDELTGFSSPVRHDHQLVGVLEVVKAAGNPVTPAEERLIVDLAGSAGLVLGNQRLNAALAARASELQESRRRLVEIQDAERRRLERDLHDGAQQQVVALKLKIGIAQHLASKEGRNDLADELGELAEEAQTAVDEIRSLAKGIFPPLLESEDLTAAIRSQAAAASLLVEVIGDGHHDYPADIESALYFAAVEAIQNAERHGEASQVQITLGRIDGEAEIAIRDDGTGFDVKRSNEGPGLTGIRDRVEALGGEMRLASAPGEGTTVRVAIPLEPVTAG
jgi:signal transduction histidine kinase